MIVGWWNQVKYLSQKRIAVGEELQGSRIAFKDVEGKGQIEHAPQLLEPVRAFDLKMAREEVAQGACSGQQPLQIRQSDRRALASFGIFWIQVGINVELLGAQFVHLLAQFAHLLLQGDLLFLQG